MKKHLLMTGILVCILVFGTEMAQAQMVSLDAVNNVGIDVEPADITINYSMNVQNDQVVMSLINSNGVNPLTVYAATAESQDYEDFGGGQRWGTWALNSFVIPGLGSYVIMHDILGGSIQLGASLIGTIVGVVGIVKLMETETKSGYDLYDTSAITGIIVGGVLWAANGIFNIVRSATYHKPQPKTASVIDPAAWNIVMFPGKDGSIERVQLLYTMNF